MVACALFLASCSRTVNLPSYGDVPAFTLTAQDGKEFSSQVLKGNVWVAEFMFTTCTGPCPRMNSQMRQVQNSTRDLSNVRLVSFTVDPGHDTPPVLSDYARHFQAEAGRWYFLTGATQTLNHLDRDVFKLGEVDGSLQHSTRFVLVDRQARIRGYYLSSESGAVPRLIADVKALAKEPS